jgi:hypothetical protein|eukprot:COSAG06_NODE_12800_length_1327_cov_1.083062_2_plen_42_part_00
MCDISEEYDGASEPAEGEAGAFAATEQPDMVEGVGEGERPP